MRNIVEDRMKNLETTEPTCSRKKPRSPYFSVKVTALTAFVLSICWVAAGLYAGFVDNHQGEYCAYVKPGEPYHMIIEDTPCRITITPFVEGGLFLVAINIPLQLPALVLWSVVAVRIRRRKRREPAVSKAESTDDFDEKSLLRKRDE